MRIASVSGCLLLPLAVAGHARGDINGFGDFSGFSINQRDSAAQPIVFPDTGTIRLTVHAPFQSRSIFYNARQGIEAFEASFTFQATGQPTSPFGACFVVQNSPNGAQSVAAPNISGIQTRFGYSDFGGTFRNSAAVSLEYGSLGGPSSSTAAYTDGRVGGGSLSTLPEVNLYSGNPIAVTVGYNGTLLHTQFLDTVTGMDWETFALVDIPAELGSTTGFVGFTASTNDNSGAGHSFSNFQFHSIPGPGSAAVVALGAFVIGRRKR